MIGLMLVRHDLRNRIRLDDFVALHAFADHRQQFLSVADLDLADGTKALKRRPIAAGAIAFNPSVR
jgi:hypothetical protein